MPAGVCSPLSFSITLLFLYPASTARSYAGFIRAKDHFYGLTYGEMTTNAPDHDFEDPVVRKGLQPKEHNRGQDVDDQPHDRPPGYGGYIPKTKASAQRKRPVSTLDSNQGFDRDAREPVSKQPSRI